MYNKIKVNDETINQETRIVTKAIPKLKNKKLSLSVDRALVDKAHELSINISKCCQIALQEKVDKLTGKYSTLASIPLSKEIDWQEFKAWLRKDHTESNSRQIIVHAMFYKDGLFSKDLSAIGKLPITIRANPLKALSALSKFLGCYDDFRSLVRAYGLSWTGRNIDDIIIDRMTKIKSPEEIFKWVIQAKTVRPDLKEFLDYIAVTGLRLSEAFHSYNLIIQLAKEGNLEKQYYNPESGMLEHFRFKKIFIRNTKKAYVSYAPKYLIDAIAQKTPFVSTYAVQRRLLKKGVPVRYSDVREQHATFMNRWLKREEIDFLHGRVSSNVFMSNYFNLALVADLRVRADQGAKEILSKIGVNAEQKISLDV
ncbi:MAG: integrase [Candidatus Bathyarchaeia archaeon]|jgi:post-segregation antitoxin (ccd killing protein)